MQHNNPVLQRLRAELDQVKNELRQYKVLYRNERNDRSSQEDRSIRFQETILQLRNEEDELTQELHACREHINSFKIPKPLKKWQNLNQQLVKPEGRLNTKNVLIKQ